MTTKGATPVTCPDFSNYTSEQIRKFKEIMDAISARNTELANQLTDALGADEALLDEYMDDCEKFEAYNESVKAQLEYHQKEIDSAHLRIDSLKQQKQAIIHQHKPKVAAALPQTNNHTNGLSGDNLSINEKKEKKKGPCTIM
jgi:predicted  nucleic acid-binding Zn-ribbon protein